jgi:HAD superfamily hydrolase (TIGR01549 family)
VADRNRIQAVTLDFFETLVFHREGLGRGRLLIAYLEAHGFTPLPWEHAVLYEVFEPHDAEYSPVAARDEKDAYYVRLAGRVFSRLGIPASADALGEHAAALWHILGPDRLDVFPEVPQVLRDLKAMGVPVAVVSNWQRGLRHFCFELGLSDYLDHVLASGDLGLAKPDAAVFHEACRRLGVPPEAVLHVGDTIVGDYEGASGAGLNVVLIDRKGDRTGDWPVDQVIRSLSELPPRLR